MVRLNIKCLFNVLIDQLADFLPYASLGHLLRTTPLRLLPIICWSERLLHFLKYASNNKKGGKGASVCVDLLGTFELKIRKTNKWALEKRDPL